MSGTIEEKELSQDEKNEILKKCKSVDEELLFARYFAKVREKNSKDVSERILVLTKNFIWSFKPGAKETAREGHILSLSEVLSETAQSFKLTFSAKYNKEEFVVAGSIAHLDEFILKLITCIKEIRPNQDTLPFPIKLSPPSRMPSVGPQELGPCGGYSRTYSSLCSLMKVRKYEQLIWDIDELYSASGSTDLDLDEMAELSPSELVPAVAALQTNNYFSAIRSTEAKIGSECVSQMGAVLSGRNSLREVTLCNTGAKPSDFLDMFKAIGDNSACMLDRLDVSGNTLDEKSLGVLGQALASSPRGLVKLNLSSTGIEKKTAVALFQSLRRSQHMSKTLVELRLRGNTLGPDGTLALSSILNTQNVLAYVDLSSTDVAPDVLCNALSTGSPLLKHLILADNKINPKKDLSSLVRLIENAKNLVTFDLSDCKLTPVMLPELVLAFSKNMNLARQDNLETKAARPGVTLLLRNNMFGTGFGLFEKAVIGNSTIEELDLSRCDLGDEGLLAVAKGACRMSGLKRLKLAHNFTRTTKKSREQLIDSLVHMMAPERTVALVVLDLSNDPLANKVNAMKDGLENLLNGVGVNESLYELDISGHLGGNQAAIALGVALESHPGLRKLSWDGNGTTITGYKVFLRHMERNRTLTEMPLPMGDFLEVSKGGASMVTAVSEVSEQMDAIIKRNQNPRAATLNAAVVPVEGALSGAQRERMQELVRFISKSAKKPTNFDTVQAAAENTTALAARLDALGESLASKAAQVLEDGLARSQDLLLHDLLRQYDEAIESVVELLRKQAVLTLDERDLEVIHDVLSVSQVPLDKENMNTLIAKDQLPHLKELAKQTYSALASAVGNFAYEKIMGRLETIADDVMNAESEEKRAAAQQLDPKKAKKVPAAKKSTAEKKPVRVKAVKPASPTTSAPQTDAFAKIEQVQAQRQTQETDEVTLSHPKPLTHLNKDRVSAKPKRTRRPPTKRAEGEGADAAEE